LPEQVQRANFHVYQFIVRSRVAISGDTIQDPVDGGRILVLPHLFYDDRGAWSDCPLIELADYVRGLLPSRTIGSERKADTKNNARQGVDDDLHKRLPWTKSYSKELKDNDREIKKPRKVPKRKDIPTFSSSSSEPESEVDTEEEEAFEYEKVDLAAARADLERDGTEFVDFRIIIRGGEWTLAHMGQEFDAYRGTFRGSVIDKWIRKYKLQLSMTFSRKLHSNHGACELARGYCHRMQYYFDIWLDQPDLDMEYVPEHHNSYEEPPNFVAIVAFFQTEKHEDAEERIKCIRNIRPSRPRK